MRSLRLACLLVLELSIALALAGQTIPNFENGWKPYGSYDGSHLDTVNLMNGNVMLHVPLFPGIPQRGSLTLDTTIYVSSKDWQIVCKPNPPSGQECNWQKGGTGVRIVRPFDFSIHRTLEETAVEGGTVTFFATGYSLAAPDAASHQLAGVAGSEDATGEPTLFDSIDLSGYHLQLSVPDENGVMSQFTLTDRHGNVFQGTFPAYASGCSRMKGNELSGGSYAPMIDDAPLGDSFCSENAYPNLLTDSNGNQFSLSPPAAFISDTLTYLDPIALTDTLGRAIPPIGSQGPDPGPCSGNYTIASTRLINYMAPDGTVRQAKLCIAEIQIQTAFNVTLSGGTVVGEAVTGVNNLHLSAVVSIVLADGSHWTFNYDNYGELSSVTLPTGGSISYTWTTISMAQCGTFTPVSRAVSVRTLTDNNGNSDIWQYHWGVGSTTAITNRVTDPAGNDTVHAFTAPVSCNLFETTTTEYQGSQSAGQLLRETDTQYSGFFATDITTTIYPSRKVKKVHRDPDPGPGSGLPIFGNVIKELEYDWGQGGPGPLLRETDTVYQWQKTDASGNRPYLTAHLLDLPASKVVISPNAAANTKSNCPVGVSAIANCMAETDYTYDEPAYLATPSPAVTVQHSAPPNVVRGNLSTSSSWLSTSNSFVSSHTKSYDTGEPFEKTDPLGHKTTITYDPAYVGAYATQTCSPQTGAVAHCVSGTYDFNTGVLTSFTNENATTPASGNTQGDGQHTSSYSYDMVWRIKSALSPPDPSNSNAVAQNLFSYSLPDVAPVTATRQKSITNAFMDSVTSSYDGLARIFKTEHAMPTGSSATVVTTYDDVHDKVSVTNPYFSTADSTYGSATTQSDALGRATTITEQDGSVKSVSYDVVTPGGVQGDCNTSIDEAGHQHRSCTDGLGRLVEVDEPNPGAGISKATANVTINGNEQANPQPAVPGKGWLTISGVDGSAQVCQDVLGRQTCRTVRDVGSLTVTVNGYPETADYSQFQNTNATAIAATLAADFHNDPAAPVDAVIDPSNPAKINFTSRSQTVGGNYSLVVSESSDDPTDFGAGSFGFTQSGATLTGGLNATSSPDTGNVTITVNGVPYNTSFGGSDTDGSGIAQRLINAMQNSPYVTATSVGATITLTSKTQGPAGNYSLSASYTWDSASFAQPSFTTAAGPALAGGYNPGDVNNETLVTLYQYDALGNLLCVEQHGDAATGTGCSASPASDATSPWRVRRFTYDSLGRLLTAHNPESGTITYSYDADGNLLQKTSPAPNQTGSATQTISYCYDELHRVTGKAYAAQSCPLSSPVVTYTYDSGANAKGKLTGVTDQAGTASYSYDMLGRLSSETRVIAGVSKSISYEYNLDGSLKTLHYPSGAAVTYTPDSAGRILSAVDSGNSIDYAASATYQADGQMTGFVSGNGGAFAGITSAFSYNKRLQPINMSANAPSQTVFSIGYDFHVGNGTSGADNGNVWGITNYKDQSRNQTFTYDTLNRLTSAQNAGTNCATTTVNAKTEYWGNSYGYDAWGNLTGKTVTKCGAELLNAPALLNNQLSGYGYDVAGNMTSDSTDNVSSTYDAENRIASASTASGTFTYIYDADGNRVEKSGGGSGTLYWYMTPGIVAESDLTGNLKSEYVFFNGERIARRDFGSPGRVFYYFSDHLKTASVITDSVGNIKAESDYYPWGGELQLVNNDSNHYKFTGKERDSESGLDYFGARYYSNGLGRFITPDWAAKATAVPYAEFADPQTLNLYAYGRNLPTTRYDRDGHENLKPQDWGMTPNTTPVQGDVIPGAILTGLSLLPGAVGTVVTAVGAVHDFRSGNKTSAALAAATVMPGGKALRALSKAEKAERLAANVAKGQAAEKAMVETLKAEGKEILGQQVGVQTSQGLRKVDVLTQDGAGKLGNVEVKSGDAVRNASQVAKDNEIATQGGTYVGKNAPESLRGQTVQVPTEVRKPGKAD